MNNKQRVRLRYDLLFIVLSVAIAIWLGTSGVIESALVYAGQIKYLESFLAGILFTSAFTTAPSIVVLGEISQHSSPYSVAFFGALGALVGDLLIFRFIRDRVSEDLLSVLGKKGRWRLTHLFERRLFRWFSPFIAGLIIASPLPDELAMMFLGFAKTRTVMFVLFSFLANFAGILFIASLARLV